MSFPCRSIGRYKIINRFSLFRSRLQQTRAACINTMLSERKSTNEPACTSTSTTKPAGTSHVQLKSTAWTELELFPLVFNASHAIQSAKLSINNSLVKNFRRTSSKNDTEGWSSTPLAKKIEMTTRRQAYLKGAVVPLVQTPRPDDGNPHEVGLFQDGPQGVDRSLRKIKNTKKPRYHGINWCEKNASRHEQ